jgi:hypothetical protein
VTTASETARLKEIRAKMVFPTGIGVRNDPS